MESIPPLRSEAQQGNSKPWLWWGLIAGLVIVISVFHYSTSTMRWQYHLIYMQSYFVPILIGAFQFGLKGGLGTSLAITAIYMPHVMLQWGGFVETNLMRFLQIALFNVIGYVTGVLSEQRMEENRRYREAAERLRQSLELLKRQSEQLSELEQQLRLADRLAVVGELTASLAHEVRNPLGAIRGAAEILRDELPPNARQSEFFDILVQETERLSAVLENYLNLARKQPHRISRFEVGDLLESIQRMLTAMARKTHVQLEMDVTGQPLWLMADPNQLRQILLNLVLNAIQAMPEGGTITLRARRVSETAPDSESTPMRQNYIEISVEDQGSGIPEEIRDKIFKPFFTTKTEGTGLGLAIVKRLADENGWEIRVTSKSGQGTTVTVRLPANNRHAPEKQQQDKHEVQP